MKNLFKNLMLVAVAAMAFTACQNDNNEVNEVAKKTVLDFVATIANQDDTRSGFTGTYTEGEDTYYQSGWDGDETFIVCANGNFDANKTVAIEDAEGHFSVAFEGNVPVHIDVYSPVSAWNSQYTPTVPAVQTPRANSVDPAAHILKAEGATVATGMVNMQHKVAYGKMTVNTPADFEISKVELSLVGLPNSYWTDNQTYFYTINANEVEGNVFWFATEEMQIVKEFTVTAYNAEDQAYSKTVTGLTEGKLAFIVGQVSTFSVSNLEVPKPSYPVFTSASWINSPSMDKQIKFWGDNGIDMILNFSNCNNDNFFDLGDYTIVSKGSGPWLIYGAYSPDWCIYHDSNGNEYGLNGGTVSISVVDGKYLIEFVDLKLINTFGSPQGTLPYAMFSGLVENMILPDSRAKLATPEVTYTLNGKTLTVSWNAVDGAVGYHVHDYYNVIDITTEETSITAELTEYKWYYIYVSAIAPEGDTEFKNSDEDLIEFELKDPRTVLSAPTNVNAAIDGRYATISWDDVEGADYYTVSYYLNGQHDIDVTETSHTIDVGFGVSGLWVYVYAKANEDNPDYLSSTSMDAYAIVNTENENGGNTGGGSGITILSINVGYDQWGEKEIQFVFSSTGACHVIDFKGSNIKTGQPVPAGYYSSQENTIDAGYSCYDFGTTNGEPSFVDCTVTNNADGTQTYEARMVYNGQTYSWTYTGAYPA